MVDRQAHQAQRGQRRQVEADQEEAVARATPRALAAQAVTVESELVEAVEAVVLPVALVVEVVEVKQS